MPEMGGNDKMFPEGSQRREASHPFTRSFIHSSVHSFIHSFIRSFVCSFIHLFFHSFIQSFIHSFVHSFVHSLVGSFVHSFTLSFIRSFMHVSTCSLGHHFLRGINSFVTLIPPVTQRHPPSHVGHCARLSEAPGVALSSSQPTMKAMGVGNAEEALKTLRVLEPGAEGRPGSPSPFSGHRPPGRAPVLTHRWAQGPPLPPAQLPLLWCD